MAKILGRDETLECGAGSFGVAKPSRRSKILNSWPVGELQLQQMTWQNLVDRETLMVLWSYTVTGARDNGNKEGLSKGLNKELDKELSGNDRSSFTVNFPVARWRTPLQVRSQVRGRFQSEELELLGESVTQFYEPEFTTMAFQKGWSKGHKFA
jgi:hypothetical protein